MDHSYYRSVTMGRSWYTGSVTLASRERGRYHHLHTKGKLTLLVGWTEETKQHMRGGGSIDCLVCWLPKYGKIWIDRNQISIANAANARGDLASSSKVYCRFHRCGDFVWRTRTLGGSRVQIPRNQFGLIWSKLGTLPWTLACILVLQIKSSPY
jgi:hypothetical protein